MKTLTFPMEFNENDFTDLTCIFFEIAQIEIEKNEREKAVVFFDEPFDVLAISVLLGTWVQNSAPYALARLTSGIYYFRERKNY